jgi:hypothetical protein
MTLGGDDPMRSPSWASLGRAHYRPLTETPASAGFRVSRVTRAFTLWPTLGLERGVCDDLCFLRAEKH